MVNYLHEITVKIPTICTSSIMSVIAPVHALFIAPVDATSIPPIHALSIPSIHPSTVHASPILSIHLSDDECQEIPDEFPGTNHGENFPSKIMAQFPDNVTLTLL